MWVEDMEVWKKTKMVLMVINIIIEHEIIQVQCKWSQDAGKVMQGQ